MINQVQSVVQGCLTEMHMDKEGCSIKYGEVPSPYSPESSHPLAFRITYVACSATNSGTSAPFRSASPSPPTATLLSSSTGPLSYPTSKTFACSYSTFILSMSSPLAHVLSGTSTVSCTSSSVLQRTVMIKHRRISFPSVIVDMADLGVITSVSTVTFSLPTVSTDLKRRLRNQRFQIIFIQANKSGAIPRRSSGAQCRTPLSVNLREELRSPFERFFLEFCKLKPVVFWLSSVSLVICASSDPDKITMRWKTAQISMSLSSTTIGQNLTGSVAKG